MKLNQKTAFKITSILALISVVIYTTQCQKKFNSESFSPSAPAIIKTISANGGGAAYCSISGGCALTITGERFTATSIPYVGPFACKNIVLSLNNTQIDCKVGPAQNGVYSVEVRNGGLQPSVLDPSITPAQAEFTYGSFLYLGSQETPGKVYGYAQNPVTGALLTIAGSPFSVAGQNATYGVVIHPNNKFIYAANVSQATVTTYSINPITGSLTALGLPTVAGASTAATNGLFFHPSGQFMYATNQNGSIAAFSVASDGTLTALAGSPFPTTGSTGINGVVVSADGKFLYAASQNGNGGVVAYSINSGDGSLTLIAGSPFINTLGGVTANPGDGITIHPNSRWLYMGLAGLKKVSAWSIDSVTGALTPIEAPILNNSTTGYVDSAGSASTVSEDGLFLYSTAFSNTAGDPKKVIVYAIDQTTGGLTRSSEVNTTGGPNDVRIDTTGRFAYTCDTKNPPAVSAFSVNKTTGVLTPLIVPGYSIPAPAGGPGIMVIQRNTGL